MGGCWPDWSVTGHVLMGDWSFLDSSSLQWHCRYFGSSITMPSENWMVSSLQFSWEISELTYVQILICFTCFSEVGETAALVLHCYVLLSSCLSVSCRFFPSHTLPCLVWHCLCLLFFLVTDMLYDMHAQWLHIGYVWCNQTQTWLLFRLLYSQPHIKEIGYNGNLWEIKSSRRGERVMGRDRDIGEKRDRWRGKERVRET